MLKSCWMLLFISFSQVSGDAVQTALSILNAINPVTLSLSNNDAIAPSEQEMENGEKILQSKNETNLRLDIYYRSFNPGIAYVYIDV